MRLHSDRVGDADAMASHASIPAYLLIYFFLVPGTIFCYLTATRARLSTLLRQGLLHFWRFVRITLLTLLVAIIVLGPLVAYFRDGGPTSSTIASSAEPH